MPLRLYVCLAYAAADCRLQISPRSWIDSEKYDVAVNIPPGATKETFQFGLKLVDAKHPSIS